MGIWVIVSEGWYKTAAELRAEADHARKLARALLPNDELGRRLRCLADGLEAEADALEADPSSWPERR